MLGAEKYNKFAFQFESLEKYQTHYVCAASIHFSQCNINHIALPL